MKATASLAFILAIFMSACSSNETGDEAVTEETTEETTEGGISPNNANANASKGKNSRNLAIPSLNGANKYKEYYVSDAADTAVFNYAVEWNSKMKGANWIAFEYNSITKKQNYLTRSNNWMWDTDLNTTEEVTGKMHSSNGFDKGHLCAAMDRDYSAQAKEQTFMYSNCFPQIGVNFNQGYWNFLEEFVRSWGISDKYDHVYIAKGGTLNNLLKDYKGEIAQNNIYPTTNSVGYTAKGLPVPKYFFMAILTQKGDNYKAIGFYVEHKEYEDIRYTGKDFKKVAVSIDELEEKTGIDFFCNLPDDIEEKIEKNYAETDWSWK